MSKKIAILSVCALCFLLYGCNPQNNDENVCTTGMECSENNIIEASVEENTSGISVEANLALIGENPVPTAEIGGNSIVTEGDRDSGTVEPGEIDE